MKFYASQKKILFAVDCVVFTYDNEELKVLLAKRTVEPLKGQWALIGDFVHEKQSTEDAVNNVLKRFAGVDGIYMEQLNAFIDIGRESTDRTISLTYFALINMHKFKKQTDPHLHPTWFAVDNLPDLVPEHTNILELAKERLRYQAAKQPLLFELLPSRFTVLQLHRLYERVFNIDFDRRNLDRKLKKANILEKLSDKDKAGSRRGAFYYKISSNKIKNFHEFGNIVPLKYHLSM